VVISIPDTVHFELTATRGIAPWVLVTHVDPAIRGRALQFTHELELALGLAPGSLKRRLNDDTFLPDLVVNHRQLLAKCYVQAIQSRDLNLTSLSLYSGPDRPDNQVGASARQWSVGWRRGRRSGHHQQWRGSTAPVRVGWLGTGDAALKQALRRDPFLAHFEPYSQGVRTLTLPHHGSIHNHSDELLTALSPEICVAPADAYRNWEHPSSAVIAAVSWRAIPVHVAASVESRLSEWVHICG
jgi:hypothetical protein